MKMNKIREKKNGIVFFRFFSIGKKHLDISVPSGDWFKWAQTATKIAYFLVKEIRL
jgi:hypothetical protein